MNDHGQRYASQVSTASETFAANRAAQLALVGRLQALLDRAEQLSAAADEQAHEQAGEQAGEQEESRLEARMCVLV